ncbi:hypothetical protein SDC9_173771 [bioreactor metagenome]|uniref:Uncharacterized protein n=1 Tax=bioreactor metagenome TaxID=1076179 RepID=A0A645GHD6_9ZZZZ
MPACKRLHRKYAFAIGVRNAHLFEHFFGVSITYAKPSLVYQRVNDVYFFIFISAVYT